MHLPLNPPCSPNPSPLTHMLSLTMNRECLVNSFWWGTQAVYLRRHGQGGGVGAELEHMVRIGRLQ